MTEGLFVRMVLFMQVALWAAGCVAAVWQDQVAWFLFCTLVVMISLRALFSFDNLVRYWRDL